MKTQELAPLTPDEAADLFRTFPRPWWVAGGWALDLYFGRETREHEDVEIAVLREDQDALREQLVGWELRYALKNELHRWPVGKRLELPIHGIWGRPEGEAKWSLEFLLNERRDGDWVFRRDPRVTLSLANAGVESGSGVPVLAPEIVLLYKARERRDKDEADFAMARPQLTAAQRNWLREALEMAEPGHPWQDALRTGT